MSPRDTRGDSFYTHPNLVCEWYNNKLSSFFLSKFHTPTYSHRCMQIDTCTFTHLFNLHCISYFGDYFALLLLDWTVYIICTPHWWDLIYISSSHTTSTVSGNLHLDCRNLK